MALFLTEDEIHEANYLIMATPSGIYELKDIYGNDWSNIESATDFGTRFKHTVEAGRLNHIETEGKKSNNHQLYRIL